jgi:hypothetical protein
MVANSAGGWGGSRVPSCPSGPMDVTGHSDVRRARACLDERRETVGLAATRG